MQQKSSKKRGKSSSKREQGKEYTHKNYSTKVLKRKAQHKNSKKSRRDGKKSAEVEEKEWYCYACCECRVVDMRECSKCQKWYHEECMGLTKNDLKFLCPDCD